MTAGKGFNRRKFNTALGAAGLATALAPFGIVRARSRHADAPMRSTRAAMCIHWGSFSTNS